MAGVPVMASRPRLPNLTVSPDVGGLHTRAAILAVSNSPHGILLHEVHLLKHALGILDEVILGLELLYEIKNILGPLDPELTGRSFRGMIRAPVISDTGHRESMTGDLGPDHIRMKPLLLNLIRLTLYLVIQIIPQNTQDLVASLGCD